MKRQDFLNSSNLRMLGSPAAAVAVMTLILSRGDFVAAIGAGIGTAVSVYVTNSRLIKKTKFLSEKIEDLNGRLEAGLEPSKLEKTENISAFSKEHPMSLYQDIEFLKRKLNE